MLYKLDILPISKIESFIDKYGITEKDYNDKKLKKLVKEQVPE